MYGSEIRSVNQSGPHHNCGVATTIIAMAATIVVAGILEKLQFCQELYNFLRKQLNILKFNVNMKPHSSQFLQIRA